MDFLAATAIIVILSGLFLISRPELRFFPGQSLKPTCISRQEVGAASSRCLVIFAGKVYDVTGGKLWEAEEGHIKGKHPCGQEYEAAIIEQGPHGVEVMEPFYKADLCP